MRKTTTVGKPNLFITTGLVGTGKSALAGALAQRLGLAVISSDVTRKKLAKVPAMEHRFEGFTGGIYSREFSEKTYEQMFAEAKELLAQGKSVVLDASFRKVKERQKALALAEESGADFWAIECVCPEEEIMKRLRRRLEGDTVSDARPEIFDDIKKDFEPLTGIPARSHLVIDTCANTIEEAVLQVLKNIPAGDVKGRRR